MHESFSAPIRVSCDPNRSDVRVLVNVEGTTVTMEVEQVEICEQLVGP